MTIPTVPPYTGEIALRSNPEDFPQNAEDQYTYLALFSTDWNVTIDAMNADIATTNENTILAQQAADVSQSNANFKGRWPDATGAATVPSSYSHNGSSWQLLNDVADITLTEPSLANSDWLNLSLFVMITDEVLVAGQDWNGVDYVDAGAVGANPVAKIYPDGSIVGRTDNGYYIKNANGTAIAYGTKDLISIQSVIVTFPIIFNTQHATQATNRAGGVSNVVLSSDVGSVAQMTIISEVITTLTAGWEAKGTWK